MTDNEIIKALECCVKIENPCKECPLDGKCISDDDTNILHQYALDLINRQKVEIERLQKTGEEAVNCFTRMETLYKIKCKDLEVAKLEAYREFAELVKLEFYKEFDELIPSIMADKIDNLVKELTEKNDFKEEIKMFDYSEIMDKVSQKLKEMYGDDFKFEEGDEFVFSLKNCSLYIALEEGCLKTKFIGDKVIDLDISCPFYMMNN